MCLSDESRLKATVTASWTGLPGRSFRRQSCTYSVENERGIESGWPGQRTDPTR